MGMVFEEWFPVALATLQRTVPIPVAPFGYGTDLATPLVDSSGVLDIDFTQTDPSNAQQAIGQALLRRLVTPRGALITDPNYGFDVAGMCNRALTVDELRRLQRDVELECKKDDRVESALVNARLPNNTSLTLTIEVTPVSSAQRFELVMAITAGTLSEASIAGQGLADGSI
jgi:hypothetical protein